MSREALVCEASIIRQHREVESVGMTGQLVLHYKRGELVTITAGEGGPVLWDGEQRLHLVASQGYEVSRMGDHG